MAVYKSNFNYYCNKEKPLRASGIKGSWGHQWEGELCISLGTLVIYEPKEKGNLDGEEMPVHQYLCKKAKTNNWDFKWNVKILITHWGSSPLHVLQMPFDENRFAIFFCPLWLCFMQKFNRCCFEDAGVGESIYLTCRMKGTGSLSVSHKQATLGLKTAAMGIWQGSVLFSGTTGYLNISAHKYMEAEVIGCLLNSVPDSKFCTYTCDCGRHRQNWCNTGSAKMELPTLSFPDVTEIQLLSATVNIYNGQGC